MSTPDDLIPVRDEETGEMRLVPRSEIQSAPLRRTLTDDQMERLKIIWDQVGKYGDVKTFEQFELDFMRDDDPEEEVQIWSMIALYHSELSEANPKADPQDTYNALLAISVGMEISPPTKIFRIAQKFVKDKERK
jgi:hypothetical protein